jgi:hypothetical protein
MKINDRTCITFDIESLTNCFTCATLNTETNEIKVFEVSERKNQIKELTEFFLQNNNKHYYVGYNNIHFDNPVINYCIDCFKDSTHSWYKITTAVNKLVSTIISSDDEAAWRKWKYRDWFKSIDLLTMLYSKALRVSLKAMEVTTHFENVQEMQIDWKSPIDVDKIDDLIQYNINDVKATTNLLNNSQKEFDLRVDIQKEYGVDCLSKDGMKIGVAILEHKICEKTGIKREDLLKMGSPCPEVKLSEVILPWIRFESKEFSHILEDMKTQTISDGRGVLTYETRYNNLAYSIGVGGLHSLNKPEIIKPKENEILIDLDAASLYPSLIIEHGFGPSHLGKAFIDTYVQIKKERIEAKRSGNKLKDTTLKLALNGVTGNLGNKFSWMYDPFAVLQIRINGQLMFLMLVEMLTKIGCKVVSANTDGLTSVVQKDNIDEYYRICKEWEALTSLELEFVKYDKIAFRAVNDYIAIKKGIDNPQNNNNAPRFNNSGLIDNPYIKKKGLFVTDTIPGKGLYPRIIPYALEQYFAFGTPVKHTIETCNDIKLFLMSEKTGKQWNVEYGGQPVQKINRFYVQNEGSYLDKWKWVQEKNKPAYRSYTRMCSKPVKILNKFDNKSIHEYNVNFNYYTNEALKIIREIEPQQLSLFN